MPYAPPPSPAACCPNKQITILSDDCYSAVSEGRVGVGQMFRYLKVLPSFKLLRAGRGDPASAPALAVGAVGAAGAAGAAGAVGAAGASAASVSSPPNALDTSADESPKSLWREYELSCPQLRCCFVETFAPNFLDLV
jgi:hypothetical protein